MFRQNVRPALLLCALLSGQVQAQEVFTSPLEMPALHSSLAITSPLNALAYNAERLIAAGQRGHILYTEDGLSWEQAQVPVSSDLTAVYLLNANLGWAVGHEGVLLKTEDGGKSWQRQLDGLDIIELLNQHYGSPFDPDDPAALALQRDAEFFASQGADKPLLDVWFEDERNGFVVGAFNLILRTSDGGQTWTPWLDRVDNPRAMHLYGIRPAAGSLFIVGEQGLVMKLDAEQQRFVRVELPYDGTLFGVLGNEHMLLVYGLRGNVWRSQDAGARWNLVETGIRSSITSGTIAADGSILLAGQAGQLLRSTDQGVTFTAVKLDRVAPNFAVAPFSDDKVAMAGRGGVRMTDLPKADAGVQ